LAPCAGFARLLKSPVKAAASRSGSALRLVPEEAWQIAIDGRGEIRERRAGDACADHACAPGHRPAAGPLS